VRGAGAKKHRGKASCLFPEKNLENLTYFSPLPAHHKCFTLRDVERRRLISAGG
jgi:hypothetical protein